MFAIQCISKQVRPLSLSDETASALFYMQENQCQALPVVNSDKVIGYINLTELLTNVSEPISALIPDAQPFTCAADMHVFELYYLMQEHALDCIAITDQSEHFAGIVFAKDLPDFLFENSQWQYPGATLIIELKKGQYLLSDIIRVIESNQVQVQFLITSNDVNDTSLNHLHIRLNTIETHTVLSALHRFGYKVVYCSHIFKDENDDSRMKWLLKFING